MNVVGIFTFLAALNERIIQLLFAPWFDRVEALKPYKWCLIYPQVGMGVLLGWLASLLGLDLFKMVFPQSGLPLLIGCLLVGGVIGGGSELVHFVLSLLNPKTNGMAVTAKAKAEEVLAITAKAPAYVPAPGSMPELRHHAGETVTTEELRGL